MAIKNDTWIKEQYGMIRPFIPKQVRSVSGRPVISYGLSSYGYDIRLSHADFRVFHEIPGDIVDPKRFNGWTLDEQSPRYDDGDTYFILPAHTYALGVSREEFDIPRNVTGVAIGKSTYARSGIIVNITPLEAGWKGYLTIEISNSSDSHCRIYANEGIAQILFFEGADCEVSYADRAGKYQNQTNTVVVPRV